MKKVILIGLLLYFGSAAAQRFPTDSVTGKIVYKEVVEVDSATKGELFDLGKAWFVDAFKSANDVIQNENKEKGEVTGKGLSKLSVEIETGYKDQTAVISLNLYYTISIKFKDGKYKYEIYNIYVSSYLDGKTYETSFETYAASSTKSQIEIAAEIDSEIRRIISSIKSALVKEESDEDW